MSKDETSQAEASPERMSDETTMSFGDHLEELRACLILAFVGTAICIGICMVFGMDILKIICHPLLAVQKAAGLQPTIQALSPTAGFTAYLKIGIMSGLILSMPWVLYRVWLFVVTGLYPEERKFFRWLVWPSTLLFVAGVLFMYYIVLPTVLMFFIQFNERFGTSDVNPSAFQSLLVGGMDEAEGDPEMPSEVLSSLDLLAADPENPSDGAAWINTSSHRLAVKTPTGVWSVPLQSGTESPVMHSQFAIDFYISFVLMLSLAFGLAFETPLVVFFLDRTGIVTTEQMRTVRKYVLFGTVCLAALLTPPDIISQMLLAGPMYLLFELGLLITRATRRVA
ncbi:MAG: twin-arginine translocase subunit TatC [Planctomycetota bacterium]|jgi:sec-independent protein translocase protein TatC